MERISKFFIDNYRFSIILTIFVVIFGAGGLLLTNSESFPTVNIGQVIIQTSYPGASADEIELKITKPIEDEIRSVTGIDEVKSISQPGLSRIFTVVDIDRYNAEDVVSDLQRAVDRVSDLPSDLDNPPSFIEIKTEEFPVIELAVVGSNQNRIRDKVAYELAELLEDNKKISSILKKGYRERQFHVLVDPQKLDKEHVSLDEVIQKIVAQNQTIPGGSIESENSQTLLKIDGKRRTVEEIESIVVRANFSGEKVLLKDVANIVDRDKEPILLNRYNGEEATVLIISKKSGADLVDLATEVKNELKAFEEKYKGQLSFHIFNDEGRRVKNRLDVLTSNAVAGLVLVVIFLIIFLPGRSGIMAALSLPLTVLAIFAYMNVNEMTLNTITILAMVISIGMLVDNSVVISENFKRLSESGMNSKTAILHSIKSLWLPITGTALTTIAAFLPMLVTTGVIGQFIKGIPIVVSIALILSLFESFILLPVRLVRAKDAESDSPITEGVGEEDEENENLGHSDWFSRLVIPRFARLVRSLIHHRYLTLILFTAIITGSLYMMIAANKFILFPAGQTEIYISRIELQRGTTLEATDKAVNELAMKVKNALGDKLAHIVATSGNSESQPNDPKSKSGENVAMVKLFMTDEAKNSMDTSAILDELRKISIPSAKSLSFEAVVNGPPASDAVSGILRSNNKEQLAAAALDLTSQLKQVDGIIDVQIDDVFGEDEVIIEVDEPKAARLGLDLSAIGRTIRSAMAGQAITDVNLENREVEFFVRLGAPFRQSTEQLGGLKILNKKGDLIPLSQVASFEAVAGSPHIKRFDYKQAKTITAGVVETKITASEANAKLEQFFQNMTSSYPDVSLQFAGEGERIKESMTSLASALLLAIIAIFALLVFLFHSYVKPIIILTTVPLGLFGVAVSFYFHSMPISFLALIGVVGLSGIIVNSGIVLISFIDQLRKANRSLPLEQHLVKASSLRLRAVVVTSLTTVSGLLPTSYGIGGSDQFIIPMTMAMAWGLVSGTILALLWVPCAYAIFEDMAALTHRVFSSKTMGESSQVAEDTAVSAGLNSEKREAFNIE